ncbi:MAG: sialidase family protein [Myxococcota bacterium]
MPSILVGTRKGTFMVEKQAGTWRPRLVGHAGTGVNFVARDPYTQRLWALLGHGHWGAKLSRSDDNGATWKDAPAQIKYPEGARFIAQDMYEDAKSEHGVGWRISTKPATLAKLWVMGFGPQGGVYVGTIPGGLFVSRDAGESFELNRPLWNHESRGGDLFSGEGKGETKWFGTPASEGGDFAPGIHSIVVDPRDPQRILVAVSTAGVIETRDGGQTWHPRNKGMTMDHSPEPEAEWGHDTHFIDQCPGAPDHIWQQNHAGVFYSSDGAATWRKVSVPAQGVHFGFPVAADDKDGRVAWLVPGRADNQRMAIDGGLFVARTEDGGQTWTQLRNGLPQTCAYDVVYRHALAQQGGVVAFGSTTGNLYVSEDRGDHWTAVGNNLPPIYSVRFG